MLGRGSKPQCPVSPRQDTLLTVMLHTATPEHVTGKKQVQCSLAYFQLMFMYVGLLKHNYSINQEPLYA